MSEKFQPCNDLRCNLKIRKGNFTFPKSNKKKGVSHTFTTALRNGKLPKCVSFIVHNGAT